MVIDSKILFEMALWPFCLVFAATLQHLFGSAIIPIFKFIISLGYQKSTIFQVKEINCIYFDSRDISLTLTRLGTSQFITGLKQNYLLQIVLSKNMGMETLNKILNIYPLFIPCLYLSIPFLWPNISIGNMWKYCGPQQ